VHLTRDGGKTWANVTPTGLGAFTKISIVEPSRFDAGTAYIAANRYQQDDFRPYLLKTTTTGARGRASTRGSRGELHAEHPRGPRAARAAVCGTETGVFYSPDDGARGDRSSSTCRARACATSS
jgi:hypothetical protein